MKILLIKTQSGLKPVYESDLENYCKIALNEEIEIEYTKKRNLKFHKKFMALCKLAFENQSDFRSFDRMRKRLIEVSGHYTEFVCPITKDVKKEPHSMSFANMDEIEFEKLYNDVKGVIIDWIGVTNESIDEEIQQYF